MKYWLVKSEPSSYAWADLLRDGHTFWDGVRNYQARNNLQAMKVGDRVLFYHSVADKEVVGIARVRKEAYQDPTTDDARWVVVDLEPVETLARPATLAEIKAEPALRNVALLRQSRLSVSPLAAAEFSTIVELGSKAEPAERKQTTGKAVENARASKSTAKAAPIASRKARGERGAKGRP